MLDLPLPILLLEYKGNQYERGKSLNFTRQSFQIGWTKRLLKQNLQYFPIFFQREQHRNRNGKPNL